METIDLRRVTEIHFHRSHAPALCQQRHGEARTSSCRVKSSAYYASPWWKKSQDRAGWRAAIECLLQRT